VFSFCKIVDLSFLIYSALLATKPKSAIDDLFADADSEEDSDDIFSSKNVIKKRTKKPAASDNAYPANVEDIPKKFLDVVATDNIATSTPESNANNMNLFGDDENDDADLFGNSKKQSHKSASAQSSTNTTQEPSKKVSCEIIFFNYIWRMFNQNVCSE